MKKLVFIIDDDDDVRDVMSYALELEGYNVRSFSDPLMALSELGQLSQEKMPGLILVDYHMPQMNGVNFVELVFSHHADTIGKIPMAICSAQEDLNSITKFPRDVIHLMKPLELEHFVKTVDEHCR